MLFIVLISIILHQLVCQLLLSYKNKVKMTLKTKFTRQKGMVLMCFTIILSSCSNKSNKVNSLNFIEIKMQEQVDSWNSGDIDEYMQHYWNSDSLMFITKSGITKGWEKTKNNYKKSYPNRDIMGELKFMNKSVSFLDEETIFVVGNWNLNRQDPLQDLYGYYSLIWKKKNNNWVIIIDHSS